VALADDGRVIRSLRRRPDGVEGRGEIAATEPACAAERHLVSSTNGRPLTNSAAVLVYRTRV
jgi:hypothetical protein